MKKQFVKDAYGEDYVKQAIREYYDAVADLEHFADVTWAEENYESILGWADLQEDFRFQELDSNRENLKDSLPHVLYNATTPVLRGGDYEDSSAESADKADFIFAGLVLSRREDISDREFQNLMDFGEWGWDDPRDESYVEGDYSYYSDYEDMQLRKYPSPNIGFRFVRNR